MSPPAMPDGGSGYQPDPSNSGTPQAGPPGGWQPNGQPPSQSQPPQAYPQQPGPAYPGMPPGQAGYPYPGPGQYASAPAPQQAGYPNMDQGQYAGYPMAGGPPQHGYPYTDPAQQAIPGQSPPKKNKVGWLIGVIAIVLVLVGTGGTLYATGVFGSGDDDDDDAAAESQDAGDQSRYVSPDEPCQALELDLSGFEEHAPADGDLARTDYETTSNSNADDVWQCHVELQNDETWVFGELSIVAQFYSTVEGAERGFESPSGPELESGLEEDYEGEWEQGKSVSSESDSEQRQDITVQDGNLLIWAYFELSVISGESMEFSAEEFSGPLGDLSTQILDKTRA